MSRATEAFRSIRSEGGLLPAELLQRIAEGDRELGGLRGEDYHLAPNEPLSEAIVRSWNRLVGAWTAFREARQRLPEADAGTTITRERWLLILFDELSYGRLQAASAAEIEGKQYPVSHAWASVPIHLLGCRVPLDTKTARVAGAAAHSPHGLLQELLNRSDERLWGFVSNGLTLRVLRDSTSLTRQAYVEFDLEQIMEGELYADFVLLWLVCHQSRVEGVPSECWLERWSQEAARQGTRALDSLRVGVEKAIVALGSGFLTERGNASLRDALREGSLSTQDYYRQLLRLVYRLLFLFVAEDRGLLFEPSANEAERARYDQWHSMRALRQLASRRRGSAHGDRWEAVKLVMGGLSSDEGLPPLGLPALGGFLWSRQAMPHLEAASLSNRSLLDAIRALGFVEGRRVLRAVDYRNLGAEELGSVYESLLELHPALNVSAGSFELTTAAGNERKTTGSYYTPTSLISCLLDSALDPVLDEAAQRGEQAILDLKVVDPACGSGHFLVAAAHRIAKRLASARTGDDEPAPEATRHALRDVVSRCIYGVDVNPMAVELCKVSLWIDALDPGRPLSFLDAHVKCGNALLGTSAALVQQGVPDDAFKPIEGDDRSVATELRRANKREREGQLTLDDTDIDFAGALAAVAAQVEVVSDSTSEALHAKERAHHDLQQSAAYRQARLAADAWCAAFVQRKESGAPRITTGVVRRLARGGSVDPSIVAEIEALRNEYRLFHWEIEFPAVFGAPRAGFDCVLGNPPWERVKLQEKEFFAAHPEIASARNATQRKLRIAALEDDDPELFRSWKAALRRADGESHLLRDSGAYPLCGRGDVNTYAVFAERMAGLMGAAGRAGCIVPTGIATDATTQFFFRDLVDTRALASLYSFENEEFIFPAVHHAFRFCLLTIASTPQPVADFVFYARQVAQVYDGDRRFTLDRDDFALLNPNTRTCPTFRWRRDAEITKAIHRRVPVLLREGDPDGNPWDVSFLRMFDMATDSGLFHADPAPSRVPLYEAKMAHHFNHRWATYDGDAARDVTEAELERPDFTVSPRWWVDESEVVARVAGRWDRDWLLGWRDICRSSDQRTVIAGVVPRVGVGDTFLLAFPGDLERSAMLAANLSAFVLDYAARQKVGGTHLKYHTFQQLPILSPAAYGVGAPWNGAQITIFDWIMPRLIELIYTGCDLAPFARDYGYNCPPFQWLPERRIVLRAELDAAFFHLYGVERHDVDYVMDTFWVVRDRDVRTHGEYRTKRLILEIYDELAEAVATGVPYRTRLDPPPGDSAVAHSVSSAAVAAGSPGTE